MKRDTIVSTLQALQCNVPEEQPRAGWITCNCAWGPWRHEEGKSSPRVFGVRIEPGDSFVNCFACGWHGTVTQLVMDLLVTNKQDPRLKLDVGYLLGLLDEVTEDLALAGLSSPDVEEMIFGQKPEMHEFPEEWLATFPRVSKIPLAASYLASRSVSGAVIEALDLRWDHDRRRVCCPIRDFSGVLRGLHGRAVDAGAEPRYRLYPHQGLKNPEVWLGEHWVDLDKPVLSVEGYFDLASVARVYRNVVSPLWSNPGVEKMLRMSDAMEFHTLYDAGTGGDNGRLKAKASLKGSIVVNHVPPPGAKDPGVMTVEQLVELLGPHLPLDEIVY